MKKFLVETKSGFLVEIGVDEEPQVREHFGNYIKELEIVSLKVDGVEIPKKNGRLFYAEFGHAFHEGQRKLVVIIKYDAFKFIKKIKNLPGKQEEARILCSQELEEYYNNVFLPAADAKIEKLKAEKEAAIQAAFNVLTDDSEIEVDYNTSYGYSVQGEYGKHKWFESCFENMKSANIDIPNKYIIETDWGDYSISHKYKLPFGELKRLYQAARDILEPQERKKAEEKAAREALRASLKCEIIEKGKVQGEELDPYAIVRLTDPKTGESLEFQCRNIFDFGYVVNPNYAIIEGLEPGGLANGDMWQTFETEKGWYDVRPLTEFEKRCLEYLRTFPPIDSGIRM